MATVTLPQLAWGSPDSPRRALLVHGLGSDAQTMWRIGEFLADNGWHAIAVDQRGHGRAPRTSTYRIDDFARDLLAVPRDRPWDAVIGHSIAGASLVAALDIDPTFIRTLVLIDPALITSDDDRAAIRQGQLTNHDTITVESQAAANPHWHPQDVQASVNAHRTASRFAVEHACLDNPDWDVIERAQRLTVPTLIVQGDPTVLARYTDADAARIESVNPAITRTMIPGTGHSPHRDNPAEFLARVHAFLG